MTNFKEIKKNIKIKEILQKWGKRKRRKIDKIFNSKNKDNNLGVNPNDKIINSVEEEFNNKTNKNFLNIDENLELPEKDNLEHNNDDNDLKQEETNLYLSDDNLDLDGNYKEEIVDKYNKQEGNLDLETDRNLESEINEQKDENLNSNDNKNFDLDDDEDLDLDNNDNSDLNNNENLDLDDNEDLDLNDNEKLDLNNNKDKQINEKESNIDLELENSWVNLELDDNEIELDNDKLKQEKTNLTLENNELEDRDDFKKDKKEAKDEYKQLEADFDKEDVFTSSTDDLWLEIENDILNVDDINKEQIKPIDKENKQQEVNTQDIDNNNIKEWSVNEEIISIKDESKGTEANVSNDNNHNQNKDNKEENNNAIQKKEEQVPDKQTSNLTKPKTSLIDRFKNFINSKIKWWTYIESQNLQNPDKDIQQQEEKYIDKEEIDKDNQEYLETIKMKLIVSIWFVLFIFFSVIAYNISYFASDNFNLYKTYLKEQLKNKNKKLYITKLKNNYKGIKEILDNSDLIVITPDYFKENIIVHLNNLIKLAVEDKKTKKDLITKVSYKNDKLKVNIKYVYYYQDVKNILRKLRQLQRYYIIENANISIDKVSNTYNLDLDLLPTSFLLDTGS